MNPERRLRIDELFQGALERPVSQREAFLDKACAGDASLRQETESLLASRADGELPRRTGHRGCAGIRWRGGRGHEGTAYRPVPGAA